MRAADLSGLFQQSQDPGADYAQGTILEFDRNTGENAVSVNGTVLENLPILNSNDVISLRTNHVVGLLKWKSQWFILGRITIPGSTEFAAAATAAASGYTNASGLTHGTSWSTKGSLVFAVPTWADRVTIIANAAYGLRNFTTVTASFSARIWSVPDNHPNPPFTAAWDHDILADHHARYDATENRDVVCRGASIITVYTESISNPVMPSSGGLTLTATCTFRSTS